MKKIYLLVLAVIAVSGTYAQTDSLLLDPLTTPSDTSKWKKGGVVSLNLSQSSFSNWAAGGEDNFNVQGLFSFFVNRNTLKSRWENNLDMGYGTQKNGSDAPRKSEDKLELNSKYGLKATPKTDYAMQFNFKSQFDNGYTYTDTSRTYVSSFMSPAYFTLALGIDHRPVKGLSIFFSPVTGRVTTVLDDDLAAIGSYGVDTGENYRLEFGASATIKYQAVLMENVLLKSKLDLFGSYEDLEAIDISWENIIAFQINKLLTTTLTTNLLYDQDILIPKETTENGVTITENKPRVQFKEVFAIGLAYKF